MAPWRHEFLKVFNCTFSDSKIFFSFHRVDPLDPNFQTLTTFWSPDEEEVCSLMKDCFLLDLDSSSIVWMAELKSSGSMTYNWLNFVSVGGHSSCISPKTSSKNTACSSQKSQSPELSSTCGSGLTALWHADAFWGLKLVGLLDDVCWGADCWADPAVSTSMGEV